MKKLITAKRLIIYEGKTHLQVEYLNSGVPPRRYRYAHTSLRNAKIKILPNNILKITGIEFDMLWVGEYNRYTKEEKDSLIEEYNINDSDFTKTKGRFWFKDTYSVNVGVFYARNERKRDIIITHPWTLEKVECR